MEKRIKDYPALLAAVLAQYDTLRSSRFLLAIGGCSRSGKTMLAERLIQDLEEREIPTVRIPLDNWLVGREQRTGKETVRERFQDHRIADAVSRLREGGKVHPPVYDPKTRSIVLPRSDQSLCIPDQGIGVIDGVVALDIPRLRAMTDLGIYVHIPDALRMSRLHEFYHVYKGCSLDETARIIHDREREEVPVIKATRRYADLIFDPSRENRSFLRH